MTDYYFGDGGNDGNNGLTYNTRRATWASISALAGPGDTIYICSNTPLGGSWTMTEQINVMSGSAGGGMVRIAVRADDDITLDVNTGSGAVQGDNKSYFEIVPGDGILRLGDVNDWSEANYDGYSAAEQLQLNNCHHFRLIGTGTGVVATTDSNFKIYGGSRYSQNAIAQDSEDGYFEGVDWQLHGTNDTGGGEWGDHHRNFGHRHVYVRCTWREGGHNMNLAFGHYLVYRECEMDADWSARATGSDGTRCGIFVGGDTSNGGHSPFGPQMIDGCILSNAGPSGNNNNNPCVKLGSNHIIFRLNHVWDCIARVWQSRANADFNQDGSPFGTTTRHKRYHNTIYKAGSYGDERQIGINNDDMFHHDDLLNNIADLMTEQNQSVSIFRDSTGALEGFPDGWKGGRYRGNVSNNASLNAFDVDFEGGVFDMDTEGPTEYPDVFEQNKENRPSYVGNPDGGDRTIAAFQPAPGGQQVGYAVPLAKVAAADTGSGSTLVVEDGNALCFYDGWGMAWQGEDEKRDYLCITPEGTDPRVSGTIVRVQYDGIDYDNDTIDLESSPSRSDGDDIYLVLQDGVTICADAGAGQILGEAGDSGSISEQGIAASAFTTTFDPADPPPPSTIVLVKN